MAKRKCTCPTAETLREYYGSVINWPQWNLEDCPVHKGENPALEKAAGKESKEQP